jgi:hypothetical protein
MFEILITFVAIIAPISALNCNVCPTDKATTGCSFSDTTLAVDAITIETLGPDAR